MIEDYDFDGMMQIILHCDEVFAFLNQYFLEDTSEWVFQEYMRAECERGKTERQVLAWYYTSWIPWESSRELLIEIINALASKGQSNKTKQEG